MKESMPRRGLVPARGLVIALVLVLVLLGTSSQIHAGSRPVAPGAAPLTAQGQADCTAGGSATVSRNSATGAVRFAGAAAGQALGTAETRLAGTAEQAARSYLATCGAMFGLNDPSNLSLTHAANMTDGRSNVRYQQTYNGVPVLAGEMIVNLNAGRSVMSVSGEVLPQVRVNTQPRIDAAAAQASAISQLARYYGADSAGLIASKPQLWVYNPTLLRPGGGLTQLVWRMELTHTDKKEIRALVLVNAQIGSVALHFNQTDFVRNRMTYDANQNFILPGTLRCAESNPTCAGGDSHAIAAHKYAGDTYDYYNNNHGRDSIDDAGMTLVSTVHYGTGYHNAFWDGEQMVYGDGAGYPLADDVVGHELTHGVTEYSSGLFYYYQSGAINESLSDVFGELVDLTNNAGDDSAAVRWQLGEDIAGGGAIRNMANPPAFGDPDKMTSPNYYAVECGSFGDPFCDNGGVHYNSGINNKAAYLMVDGDTFNGKTVNGIGIAKASKIYYEAQTNLLTGGADYGDLYFALYQACQNLIGTAGINGDDCVQVRAATDAVEMNLQPEEDFNTEAEICPNQAPNDLFFDDLENGDGKWSFGSVFGQSQWSYDYEYFYYPHSGNHFLHGADYLGENSDSYVAMKASVTLPANAYLHFHHAYGFEDPAWDGGVLEYSTDNGGKWNDAGSLIEVNGYDGPLVTSNPLGAVNAFRSDSHGYISTRVNLASLAGESVRFRWRMGIDETVFDFGWFLDDVRVYTCGAPGPTTVTGIRVTDKNDTDVTEVHRGDKVFFRVGLHNAGAAPCYITVRLIVKKGDTILKDKTKDYTVQPGDRTIKFNQKIPDDAPFQEYKSKVTVNCGDARSKAKAMFTVVP